MADWTAPMSQTFEYFEVEPGTWRDRRALADVTSCGITRDSEDDTLGSATLDSTSDVGEAYVRAYLVTEQSGVRERHPLGTYLFQTQGSDFDGRVSSRSSDGYTPLTEMTETYPPVGYYVAEGEDPLEWASRLAREACRAPVVPASGGTELSRDFVAEPEETWLEYLSGLASEAGYVIALDEMGRVMFSPEPDPATTAPVWTYDDGNSSILYPDVSNVADRYGVPNVVEVVYGDENVSYHSRAVNDDPDSPASTVSRGREIVHRETSPSFEREPTQAMVDDEAARLLREKSRVEGTLTYSHGYNGVRLGDCVRLDYRRAGLDGVRAVVTSQSISCETGCPVEETARYVIDLWS